MQKDGTCVLALESSCENFFILTSFLTEKIWKSLEMARQLGRIFIDGELSTMGKVLLKSVH